LQQLFAVKSKGQGMGSKCGCGRLAKKLLDDTVTLCMGATKNAGVETWHICSERALIT